MTDKNCIRAFWNDCNPHISRCEIMMDCFRAGTEGLRELLKPEGLDGAPDTFTEAEKGAFSHAIQRLEILPGAYFPIENYLGEVRRRMARAHAVLEKRGQPPRTQRVWMSVDPEDTGYFRKQKTEPRSFLERMREAMEKYLEPYNVVLADSVRPPVAPYVTLVFTHRDEALKRTRERRIALVESQRIFFGDRPFNPVEILLDSLRNVARPDWTEEDIKDLAASQEEFAPEWGGLSGGRALTSGESPGNPESDGFGFVLIRFPQIAEKAVFGQTVTVALHELGHLWGLDHPWRTATEIAGQREARSLIMEGFTAVTDATPPTAVWGEQAAAYLEVVLGKREK